MNGFANNRMSVVSPAPRMLPIGNLSRLSFGTPAGVVFHIPAMVLGCPGHGILTWTRPGYQFLTSTSGLYTIS